MTGVTAIMAAASSERVSLGDQTVRATRLGADAFAGFQLALDGRILTKKNAAPYSDIGAWLAPSTSALAALYEVQATLVSGTLTAGTTGSWLALTSAQTWTVEATLSGFEFATIGLEIRLASTGAVKATATINLEAQAEYV